MSLFTGNDSSCDSCDYKANLETLRSIPFFSGSSLETLKVLAYISRRMHYRDGEALFEQEELDDKAYFILSGYAELACEREGEFHSVGVLEPGAFVGGLSLLCESKRLFTLRAQGDMSCMVFERNKAWPRISGEPEAMKAVVQNLVKLVVQWEEHSMTQLLASGSPLDLNSAGVSLL